MTSVIVIGGGIIGRTCALGLIDRGCTVTLIADQDPTPASWGNAGHIATEQIAPLAEWSTLRRLATELFPRGPVAIDWKRPGAWLPWSVRFLRACMPARNRAGRTALRELLTDALPAWERLALRLGRPDLLDTRGIVKLLEKSDASERAARMLTQDWGSAQAERVSDAALAAINDLLHVPSREGVLFARTAHVTEPRQVLDALLEAFVEAGGTYLPASAHALRAADRVTVETSAGGRQADMAVVACGVRSPALLKDITMPMIAERGYHLEWDHGGAWTAPNVVFEDRALVVTRFGPRLRATSFVEFTDHAAPPDPRKWKHIERHVRALGLPIHGDFTPWYGSRPTTPDYLPVLGRTSLPGVFAACGHNHLGLTLAAITAERLSSHMLDGAPLPHAFRPDRFPAGLLHFS